MILNFFSISFCSVKDPPNGHDFYFVVNLIEDSIVAYSESVAFPPFQFLRLWLPRVVSQCVDFLIEEGENLLWTRLEVLLNRRFGQKGVQL